MDSQILAHVLDLEIVGKQDSHEGPAPAQSNAGLPKREGAALEIDHSRV